MQDLKETKKQVSLCGPFSEEAKASKLDYFEIVRLYTEAEFSNIDCNIWRSQMSLIIKEYGFDNNPTVQFGMAKRLYDRGLSEEGWPYLKQAIKSFSQDKKPEQLITDIITLMLANNMDHFAVRLGEKAIKRFPNDEIMHSTLGNCYIHAGRADDGVQFLSQAIKNFPNNKVMHTTLGNCYIHADRANEGVQHLSQAIKRFPNNEVILRTLAIAAVEAKVSSVFNWAKPQLKMPQPQIDYLDAKLAFLDGRLQDTKDILAPYIRRVENCKNSMIGLYLACVPDEDGIHALLPLMKRQVTYEFLLERKKEWEENPLRDFVIEASDTYSSSWRIHDLGANSAASRGDRESAGGKGQIPVGIRGPRR